MDLATLEEKHLRPEDYERALVRMKRDLALTQLKRELRRRDLEAARILQIVREIEVLQSER